MLFLPVFYGVICICHNIININRIQYFCIRRYFMHFSRDRNSGANTK